MNSLNIDYTKLTNTEKYILNLILKNKEVKEMNMEQLATFTNSSLGTIDRLMKKMKFSGYKQYKN
jgi:DNA-binding MurR/RpiR family transcriptional regulator